MQHQFIKFQSNASKILMLVIFLFNFNPLKAAQVVQSIKLNWEIKPSYILNNVSFTPFHTFKGAVYNFNSTKAIPLAFIKVPIQGNSNIKVLLKNVQYENLPSNNALQNAEKITEQTFLVNYELAFEQKMPCILVTIVPLRNGVGGGIEKLISADIVVEFDPMLIQPTSFAKKAFSSNSVLAINDWYKIGVSQTGVYALTKSYLKSIGINTDAVDPRTIKIYGYGAGMLPQKNAEFRFDDLPENNIVVEGENDGVFDDNDRVLFYGKSQKDVWKYNASANKFNHQNNIYSDISYYFITYGGVAGKRILLKPSAGSPTVQVNQFDQLYVHELDQQNLIKSGKRWLGEEFNRINNINLTANLGNINTAEPILLVSSVAARSYSSSSFSVGVNGATLLSHNIPAVIANFEAPFANDDGIKSAFFNSGSGVVNINYTYFPPVPGSIGWLDYVELQSRNFLIQSTSQVSFRDKRSVSNGAIAQFNITTNNAVTVWDVTQPTAIVQLDITTSNSTASFIAKADTVREYISIDGQQFFTPISSTKVINQNIHGLPAADLFIITHTAFINEAQTLAQFHRAKSNLRVHVLTVDQIYNEFASGGQDINAIRDCLRMFYKRAQSAADAPKYVTLFGRASYDYKTRIANNTNFVPTYQSDESFDPVSSYNSDDFLGLLDDNEGKWDSPEDTKELLDLAIGRLPAQNNEQAQNIINKIFGYVNNPQFGDWKTKMVFIADDEDGGIHQSQAESLAQDAILNFKDYNVKKIFIDAYNEENTSGGGRNFEAQAEIVKAVEQGAMIINYTGHGGEVGWATERILNTDDINGWTNGGKLPLFVTATCEFSRFDDPSRTSAGEMILLNPNGGGIALFTTVRLVSAGANFVLNQYFYDNIGLDSLGTLNRKRLGEILRLTKNSFLGFNERNFTLLGDPAIFLAYPTHKISVTGINNKVVSIIPDTLKAFALVTISGKVTDLQNNTLANFNGVVYPTVYDKPSTYRTINNNLNTPVLNFKMQNNVIYRGKATVTNGLFTFSFVVPKDISYQIGYGRLSLVSDNGSQDAIGNFQNFIVGKTSDSIPLDNIGPDIKLFLNDEKFVYGGITNENPLLIVKLRDENGINITGRGVGRDISLNLNNNVTNTVSLNDFYQAKINSYQEGEVRFKVKDLPQGKNMLKTTAFDVYNNSSDAMLEFVVAGSAGLALQHVLNYPNPFTTKTTFHFDHNKAGEPIKVQIQIFTISGKLIKTLQTEAVTEGNHFDQLTWDGRDDYGDNIGKGVYVYKVKVKSTTGKSAEEFQKLVILN